MLNQLIEYSARHSNLWLLPWVKWGFNTNFRQMMVCSCLYFTMVTSASVREGALVDKAQWRENRLGNYFSNSDTRGQGPDTGQQKIHGKPLKIFIYT